MAHKRLSLVGLHLVSSRTSEGVPAAVGNLLSTRTGRNVYGNPPPFFGRYLLLYLNYQLAIKQSSLMAFAALPVA